MARTRAQIEKEKRRVEITKIKHIGSVKRNLDDLAGYDGRINDQKQLQTLIRQDVLEYLRDPRLPADTWMYYSQRNYQRNLHNKIHVNNDIRTGIIAGVTVEEVPNKQYNVMHDPFQTYDFQARGAHHRQDAIVYRQSLMSERNLKASKRALQDTMNQEIVRAVHMTVPSSNMESL